MRKIIHPADITAISVLSICIVATAAAQGPRRESAASYLDRGSQSLRKDDWKKAIKDFDIAIVFDPLMAVAYAYRGEARYRGGDRAGALADYTRAIQLDPRLPDAFTNRGTVHYDNGDYRSAIEEE